MSSITLELDKLGIPIYTINQITVIYRINGLIYKITLYLILVNSSSKVPQKISWEVWFFVDVQFEDAWKTTHHSPVSKESGWNGILTGYGVNDSYVGRGLETQTYDKNHFDYIILNIFKCIALTHNFSIIW